jgi:hypothetical protein
MCSGLKKPASVSRAGLKNLKEPERLRALPGCTMHAMPETDVCPVQAIRLNGANPGTQRVSPRQRMDLNQ